MRARPIITTARWIETDSQTLQKMIEAHRIRVDRGDGHIAEIHLADAIDPRDRAMVLTAAYTRCRLGEIAALDIDHYDPNRRTIRIERSLSEVRGHLRFSNPRPPPPAELSPSQPGSPRSSPNT